MHTRRKKRAFKKLGGQPRIQYWECLLSKNCCRGSGNGEEIQENKRNSGTDLFFYVNELYKCLDEPENFCKDLWIPCFKIQRNWDLNWIRGFSIVDEEDGSVFVSECKEEVLLDFGIGECNKSLSFTEKKVLLDDSFVFGVIQKDLLLTLEIPLLVSLVRKQDWV